MTLRLTARDKTPPLGFIDKAFMENSCFKKEEEKQERKEKGGGRGMRRKEVPGSKIDSFVKEKNSKKEGQKCPLLNEAGDSTHETGDHLIE